MPDDHILSPQTTGDLIGRAIRVYRVNIREWAPLLIWPTVWVLIGRVVYQASIGGLNGSPASLGLQNTAGLVVGFLIVLFGKWLLMQKQLAFVRLTTGFSETLPDALAHLKKRRMGIVGLVLLCGTMLAAVGMLWMLVVIASGVLLKVLPIPAMIAIVFGFIGFFVSTIFIMFALGLSLAALACEEGGVTALLSRGFTMSSKCFFRTMFCGFVALLTVNLIATPMWIPVSVVGMIEALRGGSSALSASGGLPMYWQVAIAAWETIIEMITQPILYLAYGYYYYDLRLRFEGVDVLESLEALKLKHALLEN